MTLPALAVANSGYGGRGYKNPVTKDKLILPSITTVLKAENKPALIQWAVDQTAGYAVANATSLLTKSEDWGFKFLRYFHKRVAPIEGEGVDLHSYYNGVRDDAADAGTAIHEWIQADTVPELQYPDTSLFGDHHWQMIEKWDAWRQGKEIIPHFTERTVWNEQVGYAGTFDGLWEIDGVHTLMDIKTSRGLYDSTWMQLSALYNAPTLFEPQADDTYVALHKWQLPVEDIRVLHVRPNDWDSRGNAMEAFVKWVQIPNRQELYFEQFKGLVQYKHAERALRQAEKEAAKNGK